MFDDSNQRRDQRRRANRHEDEWVRDGYVRRHGRWERDDCSDIAYLIVAVAAVLAGIRLWSQVIHPRMEHVLAQVTVTDVVAVAVVVLLLLIMATQLLRRRRRRRAAGALRIVSVPPGTREPPTRWPAA